MIAPPPVKAPPEFTRPGIRAPRPRLADWWPWLLAPLLAVVLALQVLVADRARLAADPGWRPRVQALCSALGCSLPAWREPEAFHVTTREVSPHPTAAGVLRVTATFRNDAAFAQAWPQLQLSLSNMDGDALGLRRFSPREYLGSAPAGPWIEPGQSATFTLDVVDPGKRAVEFDIAFH